MKVVDDKPWFPVRHEYEAREELPGFVDLGRTNVKAGRTEPGWLVMAGADPKWDHVAATKSERSEPGGRYVPLPDGEARLVVTCTVSGHEAYGERHPEWDGKRFGSVGEAYRFAYDRGLLRVNIYPPMG